MARSNWWKQITKNDWQEPSNMTKGEVSTIFCCSFALFLFMMISSVLSRSDSSDGILYITILLAMLFLILSINLYTYIRATILLHKDNKLYVAGCTTILITAWISTICAVLHVCGLRWEGYSLITSACAIVNGIIALIYSFRTNKQAKQEGKPANSLESLIHIGWGFMPLAALIVFISFK